MVVGRILADSPNDTKYTLFSNSQSVLLTLKSRTSTSPIAQDIKAMIEQARMRKLEIDFCWVPGHVNISGNEKVDTAANVSGLTSTKPIPHTDTKRVVKAAVKAGWQESWLSLDREGRKLREVK